MSWQIDNLHTHVSFSVKHMMVSNVRGQFKEYRGTLDLDPADFTRSKLEGEIEVASIDTGNAQRDQHLRTGDFFDASNHPKITFKSTRIEPKGGSEYVLHGDLTMRGVTRPIAFDVEYFGMTKNIMGKTVAGLSARGTVNRKDFGVSYNAVLEGGGLALAEKVKIEIDAELVAPEVAATPGIGDRAGTVSAA
jgi:polyisoprenoid-binding protein YceI